MAFTHLHLHTEYSLLDGAAQIKNVVSRAKELGMDSLAITDHGVMFGVIDFWKECKNQGIHPVIGCEVYTAARAMTDKDPEKDKQQGHLVLLAKNNEGYHNLMKIVSRGFTEGFYYKPRVDKSLLKKYSGDIICLSACLAGDVQMKLLNKDYDGAKKEALEYLNIFGEGNYYLEIQDQGLSEEAMILPDMKRLHRETGIPLVATNDVHYVLKEDAEAHDVLLCIQTATTVDEENRMKFPNSEFYLKSEDEMRKIFAALPEACDNTSKIAAMCNVDFDFNSLHLPEFEAPKGKTNKEYLRELCEKGLKARYEEKAEVLRRRLEYELSVIEKMGYVEYFLIVWDFINYARQNKIMVGPGRGSAAGSIVAYTLRITDIDPIKYNLIFERFLNPERISMPDIDIDFCYERRQEVIDYVVDKYGKDKVAQIITFGTMKAKAAVRDVGRALNVSYADTDAIAKAIPFQLKMTISLALKMNPELKEAYTNDPRTKKVLDMAMALEGMPRHASTHAAGVVIAKKSIDEYVPLYLAEKGISTQFTMTTIEELGLLKMDFLGLRNLTVIRDTLAMIEENHGAAPDLEKIDFDDKKVYDLISSGNTKGLFQLESSGMTSFMKNLRPDCFEDIVAGISLYRPGPMASIPTYIENKKKPFGVRYIHESLEPILSVTYGCLVYQEQVMQIVRDLAGYTYGRSDLVRKAMSKKKTEVMKEEKKYFIYGKDDEEGNTEIKGCIRNGISEHAAEEIYNQMASFAEYAFNKSHAAAYAVIGYQTGYLKTYYPVEFMAALMTSVMGDAGQIAGYIRNCTEMGIEVLPPDINESEAKFTVADGRIRFGLLGVKNVGEGVIEAIVKARKENGAPKDINEFIENLDVHQINKKAIESLIKAGAMDTLSENRAALMAAYEGLIESAQSSSRKNIKGQVSMFQMNADEMQTVSREKNFPDIAPFSKEILSAMEKEMLGVYITDHPLKEYAETIKEISTVTSETLMHINDQAHEMMEGDIKDGDKVTIAGIISGKRTLITKNSKMMAFVQLEDLVGTVEIIVFPNVYERSASFIREDAVIAVSGSVNFKEEEVPKILADRIWEIKSKEPFTEGKTIKLRITAETDETEERKKLEKIKHILAEHKGDVPVIIFTGRGVLKTEGDLWVTPHEELKIKLEDLLGEKNVKMQISKSDEKKIFQNEKEQKNE